MKHLYCYCLAAALLSACSSDSATQTPEQSAGTTGSNAAAADANAATTDVSPATSTASDQAADPTAGVQPDEPCQLLSAAEAGTALGVSGTLQPITNQNDVTSKCLYQTAPDAQGATTTPLALEWTRDVASHRAYASSKEGLKMLNMTPELVSDLGQEAFWGIESELFVQLPGGMLTVRTTGSSPAEQRARCLKVAQMVLPRLKA
ncbi:hypothetical protein [Hymenobacter koreensis]|uniref:DUF3558 domain-containing protein n=1 Tax=Hymenobacter koreensis TaxID=1084523 RepID=A0ABP8IUI1_9BACT